MSPDFGRCLVAIWGKNLRHREPEVSVDATTPSVSAQTLSPSIKHRSIPPMNGMVHHYSYHRGTFFKYPSITSIPTRENHKTSQAPAQAPLHDIITLQDLHDLKLQSILDISSQIVTMPPLIQTLALMARDMEENNDVLESKSPGPSATLRIVAAMSTCGWITFGLISGLVLNTRGKASSFVPEWYLDSNGTVWAKLAVAAWWTFVILFWPAIWVVYVIFATGRAILKLFLKCTEKRKEKKERETAEVVVV
ncbi:uncharacterized protein BKA55DRAFT_685910 [Fusarium redolens]|uniref:Transmembrane protein n=1 Tax=Fusarium redolens TaxID=48865 RepID=A0A9P9HWX7_FUSRE|nr:uncharacterized protein BKA55DRAFT_685910 [Fusarium redolens]KAH7265443.1 hypothetical protein BKA55DRAFT_685910 [Fusarium redolens]